MFVRKASSGPTKPQWTSRYRQVVMVMVAVRTRT